MRPVHWPPAQIPQTCPVHPRPCVVHTQGCTGITFLSWKAPEVGSLPIASSLCCPASACVWVALLMFSCLGHVCAGMSQWVCGAHPRQWCPGPQGRGWARCRGAPGAEDKEALPSSQRLQVRSGLWRRRPSLNFAHWAPCLAGLIWSQRWTLKLHRSGLASPCQIPIHMTSGKLVTFCF